jgi:hypothetical protein
VDIILEAVQNRAEQINVLVALRFRHSLEKIAALKA